jgi:hypothetical protein
VVRLTFLAGPFSSAVAHSFWNPGERDGEDAVVAAYVLGAIGLVIIIAGVAAYRRAASDGWQVFGIVGGTLGADLVVIAAALALR